MSVNPFIYQELREFYFMRFLLVRTLNVKGSNEELSRRREAWRCPPPKVTSGYLARYAALVASAATGAVLKVPDQK